MYVLSYGLQYRRLGEELRKCELVIFTPAFHKWLRMKQIKAVYYYKKEIYLCEVDINIRDMSVIK